MSESSTTPALAWHFVQADRKLRYTREPLTVGKTYRAKGDLVLCENGMHACDELMQALSYAPGPIICRVKLGGEIVRGDDKLCARSRKVIWALDIDRLLHRFACQVAARALRKAEVTDERCWNAIKTKKLWIVGKATDAELAAARDAAWAAARDAAWAAARDAAWAAARAAAWDAARAAARAAAWAAERKFHNRLLTRLVMKAHAEATR